MKKVRAGGSRNLLKHDLAQAARLPRTRNDVLTLRIFRVPSSFDVNEDDVRVWMLEDERVLSVALTECRRFIESSKCACRVCLRARNSGIYRRSKPLAVLSYGWERRRYEFRELLGGKMVKTRESSEQTVNIEEFLV